MSVDIMQTIIRENDDLKHHCIPAIVISCSNGVATVQPSLLHLDVAGNKTIMPKIYDVPVVLPRSENSGITFKVSPNDQGMLIFSDHSLENWKESTKKRDINPGDIRRSDLTDAIFIPGLFQTGKGSDIDDEGLTVVDGTCKIKMKDGKVAIGNDSAELLQIIDDLITAIKSLTVVTTVATVPITGVVTYVSDPAIIATSLKLSLIKGTL